MAIEVEQIDHIELVVPSRRDAARWYGDVLGLSVVKEFEFWSENPNGPLMIETASGQTRIALFRGEQQGSKSGTGFHLLAFRTSAKAFLDFLNQLESLALVDASGNTVDRRSVRDHQLAFSVYFCDPWKNEIEITSYEHHEIRKAFESSR